MKAIKQQLPTGSRYKLLFTSHHPEGMVFVDIGLQLAMMADDAITQIIKNNIKHDSSNPCIKKMRSCSNTTM